MSLKKQIAVNLTQINKMKLGYFITARLKSSRLKRKILLPLSGNTVLDHVINRCKETNEIDDVVLCTSTNPQDAELFDYALKHQIKFFAGSEDDVLKRLLDAAKYYGFDAFVSITADNPLHSIFISNQIVEWIKSNAYKNQYRIKQDSESLLSFDEVRIPLRSDNGANYTVNDFAKAISKAITKICRKIDGVTVKRKKPSVSEGTIRIVLP